MTDDAEVLACPLCGAGWENSHKVGHQACEICAAMWTAWGWAQLNELVDPSTQ